MTRRTEQRDDYEDYCNQISSSFKNEVDDYLSLTDEEKQDKIRCALEAALTSVKRIGEAGYGSIAHYQAAIIGRKFRFSAVKSHLQKIPSNEDKLVFLYSILADYERDSQTIKRGDTVPVYVKTEGGLAARAFDAVPMGNHLSGDFWTFRRDCEIEIEKLEHLRELSNTGAGGVVRRSNGEKKLTIVRAMLLIYALGGSRLLGLDQNKMSHLIAYLIENEGGATQIEKKFSEIFPSRKPDDEGKIKRAGGRAWEEDIKIVCHYLDLVGLSDEADKLRARSLNS